jgi:hypothetical protein
VFLAEIRRRKNDANAASTSSSEIAHSIVSNLRECILKNLGRREIVGQLTAVQPQDVFLSVARGRPVKSIKFRVVKPGRTTFFRGHAVIRAVLAFMRARGLRVVAKG